MAESRQPDRLSCLWRTGAGGPQQRSTVGPQHGDLSLMHDAATAHETVELLWKNYLTLLEQVDLETMTPDALDDLGNEAPIRPFKIAAWLARQAHFIAGWSLWEYYARSVCLALPQKERRAKRESTVTWIGRSLKANNVQFVDQHWFESANSLRNLIAHNASRVDDSRDRKKLERARAVFPDLDVWQDGYIDIRHDHLADLQLKIEDFITTTGTSGSTA